ncbi:HugZ family protein [Xanthobacteraceae bacterium A53D]
MGEAVNRATGVIRRLMRETRFAALATLEESGAPYSSLVAIAPDADGTPGLLISGLARHTQNLERDPRASLLLASADQLDAPRASLLGRVVKTESAELRTRFLARHPGAEQFVDFKDFCFYRLEFTEAHLVEGFGRIVNLPSKGLLTDWTGAESVREAVDGIVSHMNEDHSDATALYATRLLGEPEREGAEWRILGLDPDGCEISDGAVVRRLDFPQRVTSRGAVREVLVALVSQAREKIV